MSITIVVYSPTSILTDVFNHRLVVCVLLIAVDTCKGLTGTLIGSYVLFQGSFLPEFFATFWTHKLVELAVLW